MVEGLIPLFVSRWERRETCETDVSGESSGEAAQVFVTEPEAATVGGGQSPDRYVLVDVC